MRATSKVGVIASASIMVATVGLTIVAPTAAEAASPVETPTSAVTVTPSTGLSDGQTVVVSVVGFPAGTQVSAAECANGGTAGDVVCDLTHLVTLTADEAGTGSTAMDVHASFSGVAQDGSVATVDCASVEGGCFVGAFGGGSIAAAPISFN
jgi:hypothetical protein